MLSFSSVPLGSVHLSNNINFAPREVRVSHVVPSVLRAFNKPLSLTSTSLCSGGWRMITAFELILFAILASCISLLTGEKWGRPDDIARPALNTTIVVLNWSRLANVNKIVSDICRELLHDTVHSAIVWNNSPRALSYEVSCLVDDYRSLCHAYNTASQTSRIHSALKTVYE